MKEIKRMTYGPKNRQTVLYGYRVPEPPGYAKLPHGKQTRWLSSVNRRLHYRDENGEIYQLHRKDGPAVISGGVENWYNHGLRRKDRPYGITADGHEYWTKKLIYPDGTRLHQ